MSACEDCDATGMFGSCAHLFHVLLALDHQRLAPWGSHHGLSVVCYFLQHPSSAPAASADGHWAFVEAYRIGGLAAVHRVETQRVGRNRHGRYDPTDAPRAPARVRRPRFTIEELSVDGSFPAEGFAQRMDAWVTSIVFERAAE